jgi:hypothetical protein
MTVGVDEVIGWDLSGLPAAASSLTTLTGRLIDTGRTCERSASKDREWRGVTEVAARTRIGTVTASIVRTAHTVDDAAESVRTAYSELADLQTVLRSAVDGLRADRFLLTPDGRVTHPDPDRRAAALDAGEQIQGLLEQATRLDRTHSAALDSFAAQLTGSDPDAVVLPSGAVVTPERAADLLSQMTDVEMRRRAWESLSESERNEIIKDRSTVIGNLDGIPFADRAVANEVTIRAELREALGEGWTGNVDDDRAERLRSMLADGRTFLAFRPDTGEFIEIVGELTPTTTNVGVFVPGTGTGLDDIDSLRKKALKLSEKSNAPVIVWADGPFPQHIVADPRTTKSIEMAVDPTLAAVNAPRLVEFTRALDSELGAVAPDAKTTVIGHSYGGSIVGTAEQLGMRADRVVYASAAGTGVDPDRVWSNPESDVKRYSITPPGDPIHLAQKYGAFLHGGDPDVGPGVTRLDSGYLSPDDDGERRLLQGTSSHTDYLNDFDSDAFTALARVIAGQEPAPYVDRAPDMPRILERPELAPVIIADEVLDGVVDGFKDTIGGVLRLVG